MAQLKQIKVLNELLGQHGQDSSISAKRTVWKMKGLDRRLGSYTGTPAQVAALVKSLKNNPTTQQKFILEHYGPKVYEQTFGQAPKIATQPIQPAPQVAPTPTGYISPDPLEQAELQKFGVTQPTPALGGAQQALDIAKRSALDIQKSLGTLAQKGYGAYDISQLPQQMDISKIAPTAAPPPPMPTVTPTPTPTVTATQAAQTFQLPDMPTASEIMEDVMASPEFGLIQERLGLDVTTAEGQAEAAKQALEMKYGQDKDKLEQNLAARGLAFSGIRTEQVKALTDELAMSKLGVDRKLATALLDANLDLKEAIMDAVADAVKGAQEGRKEDIAQLNKVGLAVVEDTLVPTMEARRAEETARAAAERERLAREKEARLVAKAAEPEVPKTVPWSEWAAGLGIVGQPIETAMTIAQQEAADEKRKKKERALSSVRANIYAWVEQFHAEETTTTREQLIDILLAGHPEMTRDEIVVEVYGLTKSTEQPTEEKEGW